MSETIVMKAWEDMTTYQNILFYGKFGSGKTVLAGTSLLVPEMRDVLYLSLEGGEGALSEIGRMESREIFKHLCVIKIQTFKQYAQIYEFLKLHVKFRDAGDIKNLRRLEAQVRGLLQGKKMTDEELAKLIPVPKKFYTVITDSVTEAQKYCMYQILGIDPKTQPLDIEPASAEWGK